MANLKQLMRNNTASLFNKTETLDNLEADDYFQDRAERFLTSVGENSDDIFEYLRDSDYNLYTGFNRAIKSKKFTSQQKADYAYLRKRFDNADTGSLKQYLAAAKDIGIDLATDPALLAALITTPITAGATLAARAALAKGATKGLKQLAKSQTRKAHALTAAEVGVWSGLHNHFKQNTEVNTDIRKLYSTPELVGSTLLAAGMGGLLGAGLQKLSLVHSKKADLFSDDLYLDEIGNTALYKLSSKKDAIIAKTIGKPTAILNTKAEISPLADKLRKKIRYDSGKQFFTRTTKRLAYSFGEDVNWRMGNYKLMYEKAISPLYTKQQGIMTIAQQKEIISILRNPNIKSKNSDVNLVAKNLKEFYSVIFKHAKINKLISPERQIKNYFPISWNRKAIDENTGEFKKLLVDNNVVAPENVDQVIVEMLDKKNPVYSEASNILTRARTLDIKDENIFAKFLNDDLHAISHRYYMQAARNIERKKAFGLRNNKGELVLTNKTALEEFEDQWIRPIDLELKSKGVKGGLTRVEEKNIVNLYKTLVGDLDRYTSEVTQGIYDTVKLSQQLAHLPLATLSSMSEILIPLSRSRPDKYSKELLKSIGEAGELFTKKIPRILQSDKHNLSQPEVFNEMNKVFLAVEEALADRIESLTGEGIQNKTIQKLSRGFFKINLLTQWTKTVQLASFNIGKDIISSNLKALHKASKKGTDIFKAKGKLRRYKEELLELGIDIEKGIKWVDGGSKKGSATKAYSELTQNEQFYQTNVMRGAGRFVNEVILNPSREQAIKPIIQSNPKADILFQFLGYPTAFSNTVLKNFGRQVILNPAVNAPRVLSATLLMTGVALGLNYFRGSETTRENYFKDPQETIVRALKRVGLLGPLEHGERFSNSLEYSKSPALSVLTLGGPIVDDVAGSLFYRRGLGQILARNIPGYSAGNILKNLTGVNPYNQIVEGAKKADKDLKESLFKTDRKLDNKYSRDYQRSYRRNYAEGGLFENDTTDPYTVQLDKDNPVLNVKDNPEERINPYTGEPYSLATGVSLLPTLQRRRGVRQTFKDGGEPNTAWEEQVQRLSNTPYLDQRYPDRQLISRPWLDYYNSLGPQYDDDTSKPSTTEKKILRNIDGTVYHNPSVEEVSRLISKEKLDHIMSWKNQMDYIVETLMNEYEIGSREYGEQYDKRMKENDSNYPNVAAIHKEINDKLNNTERKREVRQGLQDGGEPNTNGRKPVPTYELTPLYRQREDNAPWLYENGEYIGPIYTDEEYKQMAYAAMNTKAEVDVRDRMGIIGRSSVDLDRLTHVPTKSWWEIEGTYLHKKREKDSRFEKRFADIFKEGDMDVTKTEDDMVYTFGPEAPNLYTLAHEFRHRSNPEKLTEGDNRLYDAWSARNPKEWKKAVSYFKGGGFGNEKKLKKILTDNAGAVIKHEGLQLMKEHYLRLKKLKDNNLPLSDSHEEPDWDLEKERLIEQHNTRARSVGRQELELVRDAFSGYMIIKPKREVNEQSKTN